MFFKNKRSLKRGILFVKSVKQSSEAIQAVHEYAKLMHVGEFSDREEK